MKKLCICHIIGGLDIGGAERFLFRLVSHMDSRLVESVVISLGTLGPIGLEMQSRGIRVEALGMNKSPLGLLRIFRLFRILRKYQPDLVQTWLYWSDLLGGLVCKISGRTVIWGVRQSNLDANVNSYTTRLAICLSGIASNWIPQQIVYCANIAEANHLKKGYRNIGNVIPNGINIKEFSFSENMRHKMRREWEVADSTIIIGMVARYDPQKGHTDFINMASQLVSLRDNLQFVLVGHGMDADNVEVVQQIKHYQLEEKITLAGYLSDIPAVMSALDLYVSSSLGEGWPNVVAEAMSCSLPCVATDVGDTKLILGETGRLVPPGDSKALADGVSFLLSLDANDFAQKKKASCERIVNHFRIEKSVDLYQQTYQAIAMEKHR